MVISVVKIFWLERYWVEILLLVKGVVINKNVINVNKFVMIGLRLNCWFRLVFILIEMKNVMIFMFRLNGSMSCVW